MQQQRIKLLLVEDDREDLLLVRQMLIESRTAHFDVKHADRLSNALECLSADVADALLCDLELPDSRGLDTFRALHAAAADVPIVVLTGLDDEAVGIIAMREGAQDYLVKGHVDSNLLSRSICYAIERQRLEAELKRALGELDRALEMVSFVQARLLPAELPEIPGFQLETYYQPARRVGGDYFDFFPLSSGSVGLLLVDVSGRGAPAAVPAAMVRVIAHSAKPWTPPDRVLATLNVELSKNIPYGQYATACYGVVDSLNRSFSASLAGHPPPLYVGPLPASGRYLQMEPRLPLGVTASTEYQTSSIVLEPGGVLIMYTDGVVEARRADGLEFGREGLRSALETGRPDSAKTAGDIVLTVLRAHGGLDRLADDTTLIVLYALPDTSCR